MTRKANAITDTEGRIIQLKDIRSWTHHDGLKCFALNVDYPKSANWYRVCEASEVEQYKQFLKSIGYLAMFR